MSQKHEDEVYPFVNEASVVDLTDAELRKFIQYHKWIFAKSMPDNPHEYTLRANSSSDAMFCRFIMTVRRRGYGKRWYRKTYQYLDVDGWCYWTMGWPLEETILINRARK